MRAQVTPGHLEFRRHIRYPTNVFSRQRRRPPPLRAPPPPTAHRCVIHAAGPGRVRRGSEVPGASHPGAHSLFVKPARQITVGVTIAIIIVTIVIIILVLQVRKLERRKVE